MSETTTDVIWLTQEAHDKLVEELNHLKTVGRPEVTARIASAREEGDLSENGGYHAAREEQGQMEGRIRQLEHLLRTAKVGEAEGAADEVAPGKLVTIAFFGDEDDTDTFLLGSREVLGVDPNLEHSVYSPQSPGRRRPRQEGRRRGDLCGPQWQEHHGQGAEGRVALALTPPTRRP